ncbi:DUF1178 family protein [Sphingomonas sp. GC_Shp_1]|uniref:DUF1178 family protein n=1 Tax=unclassified Sphingomonas TaxID=196159 RepID=UPI00226A242B
MIVFDLRCGGGHVFEAWFGSSAAYEAQAAAGQVACPLCADTRVTKAVMAPNIPVKGNRQVVTPPQGADGGAARVRASAPPVAPDPAMIKQALTMLAAAQAKALEGSQWVGGSFATQARAMQLGEVATSPIHGQASLAEARALADEGVPIAALPLPVVPPETSN